MDYGSVKSYVYGMALMLFVVYGIYFLRISPPNRLKRVLGCIMVAWSVLLFKDVLYFHDFVITHEHVYKTLMMIDNWAVALCYIYAMELLKPGGMTWGKALFCRVGFRAAYRVVCHIGVGDCLCDEHGVYGCLLRGRVHIYSCQYGALQQDAEKYVFGPDAGECEVAL